MGMDANAQSGAWYSKVIRRSKHSTARGNDLADYIAQTEMVILNTPSEISFFEGRDGVAGQGRSVIDVTLCNNKFDHYRTSWKLKRNRKSNHNLIMVDVSHSGNVDFASIAIIDRRTPPRYIMREADCVVYVRALKQENSYVSLGDFGALSIALKI